MPMPTRTPSRPSPVLTHTRPRIHAERLEEREVFSVGLDPSFGLGGIVSNPGGGGPGAPRVQSDLFATADGGLRTGTIAPTSFNSVEVIRVDPTGRATYPTRIYLWGETVTDFSVLPDGRILTASVAEADPDADFLVRRFTPSGVPDPTFGANGKVAVDLAAPGAASFDVPDHLALTPDGDVLVYGRTAPTAVTAPGVNRDAALARLNPNGTLDPTLGGDGTVVLPADTVGYFRDLAVRPDGKIVAVGNALTGDTSDVAVYRLNADGTPDAAFGGDGKVVTDLGSSLDRGVSLAVAPGNRLVVVAETGAAPGTMDTGAAVLAWYDGAGNRIQTATLPAGVRPHSVDLAPLADGRVVYSGTLDGTGDDRQVIGRFDPAGRPDAAFAPGGWVTLTNGAGSSRGGDVLATAGGKVVALGSRDGASYVAQLTDAASPRTQQTFVDWRPTGPTLQAGPGRQLAFPIGAVLGGTGTPTGTATVTLGTTTLGTVPLGADGVARLTANLPEGLHTLRVAYSGDATYAARTESVQVSVRRLGTTVTLGSSATQLRLGQPVTFTARVAPNPAGKGAPTGTVTFRDGFTVIGTAAVGADGTARLTLPSMPLGGRRVTAVYSGDAGYLGSTAAAVGLTVRPTASRVTLTSGLNPAPFGRPVTLQAVVRTDAGGSPVGSVTFVDGGVVLGTARVDGNGYARLTVNGLTAGRHDITAVYSGSSTVQGSTSPALAQQVGAAATGTTRTTLTTSVANPVFGQDVTLTAAVTGVAGGTPTGRVQFMDGAAVIGTAEVSDGKAVLTTRFTLGHRSLKAVYVGAGGFAGSTSGVVGVTVGRGTTSVTVTASPADPQPGAPLTLTAQVRPTYQGTPIGTVTVRDGDTVLGSGRLDGNGRATLRLATGLPSGTTRLRFDYGGSSTFLGSSTELVLEV